MANLPIYDKSGAQIGEYEVDTNAIASKISNQLLHDAVVMYQANLRQGSAKSKTRAEVSGSKKKMYRQKGTGNARAGHKRSGVRCGGGHIFAKRPRDWSYRLNRKALQAATRMAFAMKVNSASVKLIDALQMDQPKTKQMVEILGNLSIATSLLIVVEQYDVNVYKSARNIEKVDILPVSEINAYTILKPKQLLVTRSAMDKFMELKVKS